MPGVLDYMITCKVSLLFHLVQDLLNPATIVQLDAQCVCDKQQTAMRDNAPARDIADRDSPMVSLCFVGSAAVR